MEFEAQIEDAIQKREISEVRRLVAIFLKAHQHSDQAKFKSSEFFRRISDYPRALKVLDAEVGPISGEIRESQIQLQLQLARILNMLGASAYALRIFDRLSLPQRRRFALQVAPVYLSNYRFTEALELYRCIADASEKERSYTDRLRQIALADCYAGLRDFERAIDIGKRVILGSKEPLLLGIAHQAVGSYYLMGEKTEKAGTHLQAAASHFPDSDRTLDRGYLEKWVGAYFCVKGEYESAAAQLGKAREILYRPGIKPEVWLELDFWAGMNRFRQGAHLPEEWLRILAYPGFSARWATRIGEYCELPEGVNLTSASAAVADFAPLKVHLDLESDVAIDQTSRGPSHRLRLELAERLLAYLVIAGKPGIPQFRVYQALWPNEIFSFTQFQKRIEQVVMRARAILQKRVRVKIEWKAVHLTLDSEKISARWALRPKPDGWLFLMKNRVFTRAQVESFFGISRSSAAALCRAWVDGKHLKSFKENGIQQYRVIG